MTEEWVVYRRLYDGLLFCEPKNEWDRYLLRFPDVAKGFELLATELTHEQADAMVRLSRGAE